VLASSVTVWFASYAAGRAFRHHVIGGNMGIMSIVWMIVVGFVVGLLARFFYPGAINMGFWMTTLIGIGGSLVGGVIGSLIWKRPDGKFHPAGWFLSIIGALILIWGYLNMR
jgi:uncharacterized membrane protein YeaQ/YmgE (transglycosylase-associated protein family)